MVFRRLFIVLIGMLICLGISGCAVNDGRLPDPATVQPEENNSGDQDPERDTKRDSLLDRHTMLGLPDEPSVTSFSDSHSSGEGEQAEPKPESDSAADHPEQTAAGLNPSQPDPATPEKLDELPDASAALYLAYDETGNHPRLLLEINGERRPVIWPESVHWAYLNEADVDLDGEQEIIIKYSIGGGTGVSAGRMGVFERDFTVIPYDDPLTVLRDRLDMAMDRVKREIVLKADGRSWRIPLPDDGTDWWPEPHIGSIVWFSVQDDRLYSSVGLQACNSCFPADLYIGYVWNGEWLVTTDPEVNVHRDMNIPYRYEDDRTGLSVRVPAGWFTDTGAFGDWSHSGEGFTILVEGHPENVIWNEVKDWIKVTAPKGNRTTAHKQSDTGRKEAWEQVDVEMESGQKAALFLVPFDDQVELTFWSEKAEAHGVLREETFIKHKQAILDMLGSLGSINE